MRCIYFCFLFLLLWVFIGCTQSNIETNKLKYTFSLHESRDGMEVTMVYQPQDNEDSIHFLIPTNYDRNKMFNAVLVENLTLLSKGKLLQIGLDHYQYIGNEDAISIRYSIPSYSEDIRQLSCDGDAYFVPAINKKFFHMYGDKSLVFPQYDIEEKRRFDVEIAWKNFPEEWHIANDYGVSEMRKGTRQKQYGQQLLENDMGSSLFFGGEYKKAKFSVADKTFHVYRYGNWKFEEEKLLTMIQQIAETNLKLWKHFHHNKDYVISITQKGIDDCGKIGGRNMANSFVFYLPGKFTNAHFPLFSLGLTHEFTHTWIGVDMVANHPNPGSMKWFTEGFTNYYTLQVAKDAGIIKDTEYLAELNNYIQDYTLSPYASLSNEAYVKGYLFDERLENQAYYKGAVFAFYLDGYLRSESNNQLNLDHFMEALFREDSIKKIQSNLDIEAMIAIAKESLGIDIAPLLQKHINKGEIIPIVSPLIELQHTEKRTSFAYGFDYISSIKTEQISGVRKGSNAYKAGLRNGQKLTAIKGMCKDANGTMIFEVLGDTEKITIAYQPQGAQIKVPLITKLTAIP